MKSKFRQSFVIFYFFIVFLVIYGSGFVAGSSSYRISGRVIDAETQKGLPGITLNLNDDKKEIFTDKNGFWSRLGLTGPVTIKPSQQGFVFDPPVVTVTGPGTEVNFLATFKASSLAGKIIFESDGKIHIVTPNGQNQIQTLLEQSQHPTWSPCGCYIAYQNRNSGTNWQVQIYSTKNQKYYGELSEKENSCTLPSWSPQGPSVAYVSWQWGNPEICIKNVVKKTMTRLTWNAANDTEPAWSPDGSKIIFASDRSGRHDVWEVGAQGGTAVEIIPNASHPSWSARDEIVFVRNGDIFVREADGLTIRQLTSSGLNSEPSWSTDGSWITFISNKGLNPAVYIMYADGSHQIKLTNDNTVAQHSPEWYSK